ncbi:hypothetical protein [Microbacterium testaceum]|uniref:hypothetical protein n=1 Tax=Microbacterium testaceum TaxID=2033 RepID=UPI0012467F6D|nr:hypothetical protein [Microbacterium testaceum]
MTEPQRWLAGWSGLVTEPATDVTLAARSADEVALVTSSTWTSELDARVAACLLAGALSPARERPSTEALLALAQDDSSWTETRVHVGGHARQGSATVSQGVVATCCRHGMWAVAVASRVAVALRRVDPRSADTYVANPFTAHAYGTLPPMPHGE